MVGGAWSGGVGEGDRTALLVALRGSGDFTPFLSGSLKGRLGRLLRSAKICLMSLDSVLAGGGGGGPSSSVSGGGDVTGDRGDRDPTAGSEADFKISSIRVDLISDFTST